MSNEPTDPRPESAPTPTGSRSPGSPVRPQRIRRPPLTVGVYFITAVCGMLDAASFLGLGLIFVETMTGNILLLCFSLGVRGSHGRFASAFPGGTIVPYLAALAAFGVGAVAGGRLVRAGELGRRVGFAIDGSLIGIAALVIVLTHPGPATNTRYPVIMTLACAMGVQNTLMRRWGIQDLATNLFTFTYTGLWADCPLGGGNNPRWLRRSTSLAVFVVSATAAAFLTRYGVLWPVLTAFALFILALPILLQPRNE